jgi:hypothetical protein
MATHADVRRIALSLPHTVEETGRQFSVAVVPKPGAKPKSFVWQWLERVDPKKARVPNKTVVAIRVANTDEKALLLAADPDVFFTEPHYNGYPAVLVRLAAVDSKRLRDILTTAHALFAPKPSAAPRSPSRAPSSRPRRAPARAKRPSTRR